MDCQVGLGPRRVHSLYDQDVPMGDISPGNPKRSNQHFESTLAWALVHLRCVQPIPRAVRPVDLSRKKSVFSQIMLDPGDELGSLVTEKPGIDYHIKR